MSLSINTVMLAGHLTRDPQTKYTANEKCICNFGLAMNRRYKGNDGQQKEETTFVDIECFGKTAELVSQYLNKGSGAYIEGRLKLDQWDDAKDGSKRSKLKVVADRVQFLGSGKREDGDAPAKGTPAAQGGTGGDSEPPFQRLREFEL